MDTDNAYDFSGLTGSQQWLLTVQGWTPHTTVIPKPRRSTVQPLIDRGLVIFHPLRAGGKDPGWYEVPLAVHIAWCFSNTKVATRAAKARA